MSQSKYFREELTFLKEQGKEFTEIYPQLARFLNGNTTDPDVERLLEGFAFLSAKLREKVDDEFPELTHSIINMLWPNYLRPVPSMSILAFSPEKMTSEYQIIQRGTSVESKPVLGTKCKFKTCRDVEVYPIVLSKVYAEHTRESSRININLSINSGVSCEKIKMDKMRFYLGGDKYSAQMLYLWMNQHLKKISIEVNGEEAELPDGVCSVVGFSESESLLPYPKNVYEGYRIFQEFLYFPQAFYFIDISGLQHINKIEDEFSLKFRFTKTLPTDIRVSRDSFQLYCTPVVNLFEHDAEPIDFNGCKSEYAIVPSSRFSSHYEIFYVNQVIGWKQKKDSAHSGGLRRVYLPFESFQHEVERSNNRVSLYYRSRVKESIRGDGYDTFLSFVRGDESESVGVDEAVSVSLTCTNRMLPAELGIGDICEYTEDIPSAVKFHNILQPTQSVRPVLDGSLLWTLISNLSLNYLSLLSKDALCSVLRAYDFKACVDRQAEKVARMRLDAISEVESYPVDKIIRGMTVRGLQTTIHLDQKGFASEGELYLFGTVLSRFFALYASINSFHELIVVNQTNNEKYRWGIQSGIQPLM
ncbi:type VI secretion system baseplate subunit TssF [Vibrio sp. JC009]|uniref:type VI secretion system baseplate subunit TssF n=1 Tax=Vibrio sp. JC009 TaxID=2912314 RepID=UPI0023AF3D22|nr:type VI secretion system baseplate subunit TssF [Vibrio sp. JC009]WED24555.1 type VI secretion system baseplate subunit TssF [Vibrio sp. JC009]